MGHRTGYVLASDIYVFKCSSLLKAQNRIARSIASKKMIGQAEKIKVCRETGTTSILRAH